MWLRSCWTVCETYKLLKEKNIKTRQGKNFSKTNLSYVLRNVLYVGKIKHNGEVYSGLHEPIISGEIFDLAQQIHKEKKRKFRVYKNYLFGGLIKCAECGSHMTPCFTNKNKGGKLKRYFYYRCTSTMRNDWQSCSVRQVSTDRLERYILENLERISVDKEYVENLVFRLNHDAQMPRRAGYELSEPCSELAQFSTDQIMETLNHFIKNLPTQSGLARNLFAQNTVQNILYAPSIIKIVFKLRQNLSNFAETNIAAPINSKQAALPPQIEEKITDRPNVGFEPYDIAPNAERNPNFF